VIESGLQVDFKTLRRVGLRALCVAFFGVLFPVLLVFAIYGLAFQYVYMICFIFYDVIHDMFFI